METTTTSPTASPAIDAGASVKRTASRPTRKPVPGARGRRIASLSLSLLASSGLGAMFVNSNEANAATTTAAAGAAKSFTGDVDTNKWGPVQVKITTSAGKITNVVALQTPNSKNKSVSINNRAVPVLKAEALTAQSSSIQNVSGATYTSDSYAVSLQSAIDKAVAAGALVAA